MDNIIPKLMLTPTPLQCTVNPIPTPGVGVALQPDLERWRKCRGALVAAVTSKRVDADKEQTILRPSFDDADSCRLTLIHAV